jgi:hypothetical protein
MNSERMAAELAGALRAVLGVEEAMTFGTAWNDSRIHAREVLARYQANGPDAATELLRACRRLLYWASAEESRGLSAAWRAQLGELRRTVDAAEASIFAVVTVGAKR